MLSNDICFVFGGAEVSFHFFSLNLLLQILDKLPPDEILEAVSIPILLVGKLLERVSYLARNALAIDRLAISRDDRIQVLVEKVREEIATEAKQR